MLKHFLTPNSKLEQFLVEKIVENCESAETFWGDDIFFKFGLQYSHIKRRFQMKNRLNFETMHSIISNIQRLTILCIRKCNKF
jgi:hypothetical protein